MLTNLYCKAVCGLKSLKNDERGVTAIEYAIIGVAISAIVLAVFTKNGTLGTALTNAINTISTSITTAGK